MSKALFVTATGTDVGKTFISSLLVKKLLNAGLNAGYYKPALSGLSLPTLPDTEYVKQVTGISQKLSSMVSYSYQDAVSPHLAARREGSQPEIQRITEDFSKLNSEYEYITVEGCGGIICPLCYDDGQQLFLVDVVKRLGLQTIVVTNAELGTINSTLLTLHYLRQQNITVLGLIINNYQANDLMQQDNKKMLTELSQLPILALVEPQAQEINIDVQQLIKLYTTPEVNKI